MFVTATNPALKLGSLLSEEVDKTVSAPAIEVKIPTVAAKLSPEELIPESTTETAKRIFSMKIIIFTHFLWPEDTL